MEDDTSISEVFAEIIEDIENDPLFEESVLNSSFTGEDDYLSDSFEEGDGNNFFTETEEEDLDYHPGDLINLRGLFDEDAVDARKVSTTLDFEEIPDDIDIDEPIEIEQLSRAGRIMNVVVKATLIIFALIVLGFIINAGLVIGAVLSSNFQNKVFIDVSNLTEKTAQINATVMTEISNFGSFIVGELDPVAPVRAHVYLSNGDKPSHNDAMFEIEYQPPEKEKVIRFNGGERQIFHLEKVALRLNPKFDASRLSGFMEPMIEGTFHERFPRNMIVHFSANLVINSFWIPIPYEIDSFLKFKLDTIDEALEKEKQRKMKEFDFNPKFVDISKPRGDKLTVKVRQPVPKFYAPPAYKVSVHMPAMDLIIKQFTMKNPAASPNIEKLFNVQSNKLAKAKVKPFRMMLADDDMTPNIIDMEAEIEKQDLEGLLNVLRAIRDDKLGTLAFLFAFKDFDPTPKAVSEADKDATDENQPLKPEKIDGCSFVDFMKSFWGRQAYPVAEKDAVVKIPSVPELYNPAENAAFKVEFNGITAEEEKRLLSFKISANTHYVISEYKLPLLMLSGELPPVTFKMNLNTSAAAKKQPQVARFKISHSNPNEPDEEGIRPLGNELVFNVLVELEDLKLLTHFALKLQRMSQVKPVENGPSMEQLIGRMFKGIEGADIFADFDERNGGTWVSRVASVFDMKFDLSGEQIEFTYAGNGKAVIQPSKPKTLPVYSEEAEEELTKKLNDLLGIKPPEEDKNKDDATRSYEVTLRERIEVLKKSVMEAEKSFHETSNSVDDYTIEAKAACESELKAAEKAGSGTSAKEFVESATETPASPLTLDHHKKLEQVRKLLSDRLDLLRAIPVAKQLIQNSLYATVDSDERKMAVTLGLALHKNERQYYDHVVFEWRDFVLELEDHRNVHLGSLKTSRGSLNYSLVDGMFCAKKSRLSGVAGIAIFLEAVFGPKVETLNVTNWMRSFRTFYDAITDPLNLFVPFHLGLTQGDLDCKWKSEIPAAGIPALPTTESNSNTLKANEVLVPGFFDNLAKSHFDFIGYGFYQLIFHAILPNPETCPAGSSLLNVELNLPPSSTFLFASADTGDLKDQHCVASINTARPLRLWTQIVDGVLCNGYAVAEGFEEQVVATQARISREKAADIIDSFEQVLLLRKLVAEISSVSAPAANHEVSEYPLLNAEIPHTVDLDQVPEDKRYALITAVPVNIEILDFEHLIKIIDAFGEKRHVLFSANDPTIGGYEGRKTESLFNILTSAVASSFPLEFNTAQQVESAARNAPTKIVHVKSDKIVLDIKPESPSPSELTVNVNISMPSRKGAGSLGADQEEEVTPYVPYETLSAEKRFLHPVIRWGQTSLNFAFPKFTVSLKLSPGDIKITNDGEKVIFDALKDFTAVLEIKGRNESKAFKETFKTSGIRDVFKKCQNYYNQQIKYEFDEANVIETTSTVEFGPNDNQKFNYVGLADIESFYLIQAVVLRRMFTKNDDSRDEDEDYDPREDPTFMDFGLLVSVGNNRDSSEDEAIEPTELPKLALPCFFTNFCSAEQLDYTQLNRKGLLYGSGKNYVPLNLHIRDTFQPLTASIAAGFSTVLTLFHMENYPKTFVWKLHVPKDQAAGLEMNGQGMFHGLAGPLTIEKSATIPYQNALDLSTTSSKHTRKSARLVDSDSDADEPSNFQNFIQFSERKAFEREFYGKSRDVGFKDEVIIPVLAQVPDSLPDLLRKMLWPMFFMPMDTVTLHPPLMNIEKRNPDELAHPPIAVALSDSMVFKDAHGNVIRPSLLAKLFSAFIEESSSTGIEVHSQNPSGPEPSCFRWHIAINRELTGSEALSVIKDVSYNAGGDLVHVVVWLQFPWALNSIGFDFGSTVYGKISFSSDPEAVILHGQMTKHHMIGKVARMRLDLSVPVENIWQVISVFSPIAMKLGHSFLEGNWFTALPTWIFSKGASWIENIIPIGQSTLLDIPLSAEFNVDGNFMAETEFIIPKRLIEAPQDTNANAGKVTLHHTKKNIQWIMDKYETSAPQAIACVYNRSIRPEDLRIQSDRWTKLDMSMTRVYYSAKIKSIKPGDNIQLFLQLRTYDQLPVCGLLAGIQDLAIKVLYMKPSRAIKFEDHEVFYKTARQDNLTSVFTTSLTLERTGRYKIYAALRKKGEKVDKLRYKEIKFTEIYVQNAR